MARTTDISRVAVHGSYFARNFGDTLLIKTMCDWLAETVGRENVFLAVEGHTKEQNEIGYPVATGELRKTITHLIFAGGGYFGEPNKPLRGRYRWYLRNYQRHMSWIGDYRAARKAVFGIGVGPISDPVFRHAVRRLLRDMDPVFVRDETSLDYARKYRLHPGDVSLGIDLALSIEPASIGPRYAFGIHINSMPEPVLAQVTDALVSHLSHRKERAPAVTLIADTALPSGSRSRYETLAKRMNLPVTFHEYAGVDDLVAKIADCETVITSKLHVGIVASALGRTVISLPVHQKTARFYNDLSLQKFCLQGQRQRSSEISRLLDESAAFEFDRKATAIKIAEMRRGLQNFVGNMGADG